jgi:hypothetical protein
LKFNRAVCTNLTVLKQTVKSTGMVRKGIIYLACMAY